MASGISVMLGQFAWLLTLLFSAVVLVFIAVIPLLWVTLTVFGFLLLAYCALLSFVSMKTEMQILE